MLVSRIASMAAQRPGRWRILAGVAIGLRLAGIAGADELQCVPDPGVRVEDASNPIAEFLDEPASLVRLAVSLHLPQGDRRVSLTSTDGLAFWLDQARALPGRSGPSIKLDDGLVRRFIYDPEVQWLLSEVPKDGITFAHEIGVRDEPQPQDYGTFGV